MHLNNLLQKMNKPRGTGGMFSNPELHSDLSTEIS